MHAALVDCCWNLCNQADFSYFLAFMIPSHSLGPLYTFRAIQTYYWAILVCTTTLVCIIFTPIDVFWQSWSLQTTWVSAHIHILFFSHLSSILGSLGMHSCMEFLLLTFTFSFGTRGPLEQHNGSMLMSFPCGTTFH
ncbi:hypothetical protein O6H91_14G026800 [Diphasiastrum complanatum]|uniref:Uncharacterized protein n=1 Tax=Diphasiastrum complanatum TaxID=34168 RepID=A0ACC2BMJ3_DIPCM|nr:hypothetical protein O6H91_14G026800 [Diphasiastrum complanatum]